MHEPHRRCGSCCLGLGSQDEAVLDEQTFHLGDESVPARTAVEVVGSVGQQVELAADLCYEEFERDFG